MTLVPISVRLEHLTDLHPDRVAITVPLRTGGEIAVSWGELDARANHCARRFAAARDDSSDVVVVALPTGIDHVVATLAAWKLGLVVVPLDPNLSEEELRDLLGLARPGLCVLQSVVDVPFPLVTPDSWGDGRDPERLPPPATEPRSATATGGSGGRPRIIFRRRGWLFDDRDVVSEADRAMRLRVGQVQLVATALFHTGFSALYHGLALDHHIVLPQRFVPRLVLDAVERYRVNALRLVPTMMKLLLDSGDGLGSRDLSSVESLQHGTAPCPVEVKRAWLRAVDPRAVVETYGSQEQVGVVQIRGDEWLEHPGSVGRPAPGTIAIVTDDGALAEPGEVGRIHLKRAGGAQPVYLGGGPRLPEWGDGYFFVGDVGRLDADGYLFVSGRIDRTINVGGVTVHAAEIEAALLESPLVADACVVGRPHDVLGEVPHALVVPSDPDRPDLAESIGRHCRGRLSGSKVPSAYELVAALPRNEAGKLRYRSAGRS